MGIRIAAIEAAQYAEVGQICADAYRQDGQFSGEAAAYEARLRDLATRSRQAEVLVASDPDGQALGTVTVCPPGSPLREVAQDAELEFRMLAVAPHAQGRGVGEGLVRACLDYARGNGFSSVVLSTRADAAQAAHRLYGRLGFTRQPQRDWEPVPGVSLIAMSLTV